MASGRICARGFDIRVGRKQLTFLPGDRVPPEVVALVKNDKIWEPKGGFPEGHPGLDLNEEVEQVESEDEFDEFLEESDDDSGDDTNPLENMTVRELRGMAEEAEIDLQGATKKRDIIDAIRTATAD